MKEKFLGMRKITAFIALFCALIMLGACKDSETKIPGVEPDRGYKEPVAESIRFSNAEFVYWGDDVGERYSDGWLVKLYTEMEIDELGNPIGPGCVVQLLLNAYYNSGQEPNPAWLEGIYGAQTNSGDFNPMTFVDGYMDYLDLPTGRIERPDGTFYADLAEGSVEMEVDLIDDGAVQVTDNGDGTYSIEGILVGKKCRKHYFSWQGEIQASSYVEPEIENSTLSENLVLNNLTQGQLQDRGDYFALRDESYRSYLLFLADEGVDLSQSHPSGSGNLLRLELLVPWESVKEEGIPAGTYPLLVRNADTSIDRDQLTPFHAIPGLPNRFAYPYWSGAWYVSLLEGEWSETYARIDRGVVEVERRDDGAHFIRCELEDCASPAHKVQAEITLEKNQLIVL